MTLRIAARTRDAKFQASVWYPSCKLHVNLGNFAGKMAAIRVSEGVMKEILKEGDGSQVQSGQKITVHCTGSLTNPTKKFWSTRDAGQEPFSFQVGKGKVIKGWDEGCLTMKQGENARFTISARKGYGARGFAAWNIPPNAELQFEIELLSME